MRRLFFFRSGLFLLYFLCACFFFLFVFVFVFFLFVFYNTHIYASGYVVVNGPVKKNNDVRLQQGISESIFIGIYTQSKSLRVWLNLTFGNN